MNCEKWYKNQQESSVEAKENTILLDFSIQTDRKIKCYRTDIVIKNYKRK